MSPEIQRIAAETLSEALAEIARADENPHEAVHEVRKRIKRLRGLLRLVRHAAPEVFALENGALRDAARELSALRDDKALEEAILTLDQGALEPTDVEAVQGLATRLAARSRDVDPQSLKSALQRVDTVLLAVRERSSQWALGDLDWPALVRAAGRTYRKARQGFAATKRKGNDEVRHEWRKRVKYVRDHAHLLHGLAPERMGMREQLLDALAQRLGDHHDLALLRATLANEDFAGHEREALSRLIEQRQDRLDLEALALADRAFARGRKRYERQLERAMM